MSANLLKLSLNNNRVGSQNALIAVKFSVKNCIFKPPQPTDLNLTLHEKKRKNQVHSSVIIARITIVFWGEKRNTKSLYCGVKRMWGKSWSMLPVVSQMTSEYNVHRRKIEGFSEVLWRDWYGDKEVWY